MLAALLLAGCGGGAGEDAAAELAPTPAAETTGAAAAGGPSPTDLAWIQLMIPLNDQLLPLLDEIGARGDDPALRVYAGELAAGHRAELDALHALLDDAGVPYTNLHEGHNMPGMVTDEELAELAPLAGPDFDRAALVHLTEHLEQSGRVSGTERDAGTAEAVTALAGELDEARTDQLAELRRLGG